MPLNMAKAMATCLRQAVTWLESEADLHDRGEAVRVQDGRDVSRVHAEDLRHRARNMEASGLAFERVMAREDRAD